MRKKSMKWLAAAAVLFFCCALERAAQAEPARPQKAGQAQKLPQAQVTGINILAVGVFVSAVTRRESSSSVADGIRDTARGFALVKRGAAVEARLDTGIGLRYQLTGAPKGAQVVVDVVVRHPQMVNPDTQLPMTHSIAQFERTIGAVEHSVWSFDTQAGLVPGEYVIEILHRGRPLARQAFQVTVRQ